MGSKKLLFDASSLIYALKLGNIEILCDNYIQQLTIYEAINAIWREARLVKSIGYNEAVELVKALGAVIDYMKALSIHPYEQEVLENALELGLTAYDTSYIVLARKHGLTLVTEDRKLIEKAKEVVNAVSLEGLIKAL